MIERVAEFLNTIDLRSYGRHAAMPVEARDTLTTPTSYKHWLEERGLRAPPISSGELEAVRFARASIRTFLAQGQTAVLAAGEGFTSAPPKLAYQIDFASGRPLLLPICPAAAAVDWLVAEAVAAAANGEWSRLKMCAAAECRWIFVDRSRNGLGRWCSMRSCGNRHKVRRYRRSSR